MAKRTVAKGLRLKLAVMVLVASRKMSEGGN